MVVSSLSVSKNQNIKVFGAAFFKKLLGLQGVKPLHGHHLIPSCS